MYECVSLEERVECDTGEDLEEEEEKYGRQEGEKWVCNRGSLRGMSVENRESA